MIIAYSKDSGNCFCFPALNIKNARDFVDAGLKLPCHFQIHLYFLWYYVAFLWVKEPE